MNNNNNILTNTTTGSVTTSSSSYFKAANNYTYINKKYNICENIFLFLLNYLEKNINKPDFFTLSKNKLILLFNSNSLEDWNLLITILNDVSEDLAVLTLEILKIKIEQSEYDQIMSNIKTMNNGKNKS